MTTINCPAPGADPILLEPRTTIGSCTSTFKPVTVPGELCFLQCMLLVPGGVWCTQPFSPELFAAIGSCTGTFHPVTGAGE